MGYLSLFQLADRKFREELNIDTSDPEKRRVISDIVISAYRNSQTNKGKVGSVLETISRMYVEGGIEAITV